MRFLRKPADQDQYLERRKAELGLKQEAFQAARNIGQRRGADKCALFRALADEAKISGRKLPFRVPDDFDVLLPDDWSDASEGQPN